MCILFSFDLTLALQWNYVQSHLKSILHYGNFLSFTQRLLQTVILRTATKSSNIKYSKRGSDLKIFFSLLIEGVCTVGASSFSFNLSCPSTTWIQRTSSGINFQLMQQKFWALEISKRIKNNFWKKNLIEKERIKKVQ